MRTQRVRLLAFIACALATACSNTDPIDLFVIHPDDANPWVGPDAATQARITLGEMDAGQTQVVDVAPNGSFDYSIAPSPANAATRLHVEALRNGEVISTGVTPPTNWQDVVGHVVYVFMQPPDSLVPSLGGLTNGRAGGAVATDGTNVVFPTVPDGTAPGASGGMIPEWYDTLSVHTYSYSQTMSYWCDSQCSVLMLTPPSSATMNQQLEWLFIRGWDDAAHCSGSTPSPQHAIFDNSYSSPPSTTTAVGELVAGERCQISGSTVVPDTSGSATVGGWFLGGHVGPVSDHHPTNRIDYFGPANDGTDTFYYPAPGTLATARDQPLVFQISAPAPMRSGVWLVFGGQSDGDALMDTFTPSNPSSISTAVTVDDHRTDAAIACLQSDASDCTSAHLAMVVGGESGGSLAQDDFLVDLDCVRSGSGTCSVDAMRSGASGWLHTRRRGAHAAWAEGGSIVVAGGTDAMGNPVFDVEAIDVSHVAVLGTPPQTGHVVGTYPCADPYVVSMGNGSVMLAGGRHTDGSACSDVWFYRR